MVSGHSMIKGSFFRRIRRIIKNKLDFCQTAIELIADFDDLTDEVKALIECIVEFVGKNK